MQATKEMLEKKKFYCGETLSNCLNWAILENP
jgi:hypothetical protein